MDALFSLPVLSVLLIPTLSTYSTTLNLVFFYVTWTTLVLSHSALRVELFGTIAVRLLFYVFPSVIFFLFDILTPSAAVIFKAQGEHGLPSGKKRGKIRLREFKVAGWALFNIALGIAVQTGIEHLLMRELKLRSALKVSIKLPMPWEIGKDITRGMVVREILTYVIHRYALHPKRRRTIVNRYHNNWYHTLVSPYPLTAHYDHPLVYLLKTFAPTYGPAVLFRFHLLTYLVYLIIISIEETFAYSGYTIMPTRFFLFGIARRVDDHMISGGSGNYGTWGILDWICGTSLGVDDDDDGASESARRAAEKARRNARMKR
ncbi:hypothetical protein ASPZODRAFT_128264 [Penicilliopsis zonata CBS 506.65]|uniref:Fatty acid hydroxylase domain-containing protein n=1 Tax=Penicilliopsis zonata CBS 506.65 TaxID=1073090 RepID=A0A1L9SRK0_9EURO|nr:hypothetical protein ASPZODRAFT_128264 [Penicilliopsis zonata CBS 506.65]OJJ49746.1 hypothetical protein ASPZODRAFT_128264 [Penicilliopsis zonata CBS 506.65]